MTTDRGPTASDGSGVVRVRIPVRIDFAGGWSDVHEFSAREGGATLSGAIDRFVTGRARTGPDGLAASYETDHPPGSGLGTSAALDVAWLALTDALMGRRRSAVELAEGAYRLEKALGVLGGKQDQYAAAIGGFNHLRFGAEDEAAQVEHLELDGAIVRELEERLVLGYTGSAHRSTELHARVWSAFAAGDDAVRDALRGLRDSVRPARDALVTGDLAALAELMTLGRELARRMVPALVTPAMDRLFAAAAEAGSSGSKACGAGGGGCLVFLCRPGRREAVCRAVEAGGAIVMPIRFVAASGWGPNAPA